MSGSNNNQANEHWNRPGQSGLRPAGPPEGMAEDMDDAELEADEVDIDLSADEDDADSASIAEVDDLDDEDLEDDEEEDDEEEGDEEEGEDEDDGDSLTEPPDLNDNA